MEYVETSKIFHKAVSCAFRPIERAINCYLLFFNVLQLPRLYIHFLNTLISIDKMGICLILKIERSFFAIAIVSAVI